MKKEVSKKLNKSKKKKLVETKYCLTNISTINLNDVTYSQKIYLLTIFRTLTDENFNKILPLNNKDSSKKLSPSKTMDKSVLECLYSKGVLAVDSKSNLEAFQFNNNECVGFNIDEVCWVLNISSNIKDRIDLDTCFNLVYNELTKHFPKSKEDRDQAYYLTMNLALNEVESYLFWKMKELNYKYEMGDKTFVYVYQLFDKFSVSEILNIVDKAVDEDYLFNSRTKLSTVNYGSTISTRILELGELADRGELSLIKMPRKEFIARSEMSKLFYELIHSGSDEGFSECPMTFWNDTLESRYTPDSE